MRVLVTTDDGGQSAGLRALARDVGAAYPETVVVAPLSECGNYGTSLRRHGDWAARTSDLRGTDRSRFRKLPATPALLVRAACEGVFGSPPDVVVVGINYGPNVGRGVLHSGTVGAVLTAANLGVRAVAISLDDVHSTGGREDGHMYWETAAEVAVPLIEWMTQAGSGVSAVNVNVPNREPRLVEGAHEARLAAPGQGTDPLVVGTDISLLAAGYITVSALAALDGETIDAGVGARLLDERLRQNRTKARPHGGR